MACPIVHTSTAISQSAPSLPEALLKFKRDSRFHHPRTSAMNQNGKLTHQAGGTSNSSPIRHLSNALFRDPNKIPHGLLDQALKSQLMRSQLDLITSLQDVPTRLVVVKKARLSALRAELTVLNHSLPKGCCLGMYCNRDHCDGGDKGEEKSGGGSMEAKLGIVRVSPNESVVLNSADRAPFLIHIEVLKDHLDFDPNRRSNYEDLRKAIKGSAISANKATNSKTPNPNIYLINDSSPSFSESNVNKLATAEQPSCRSSTNQHTIKSLGMAKISSLLPPVGESFNHLGLASIISPTDHTSCSSAHSSDHGFKHQLDHPSQTLRRALSFDFPEEEIDLVEQIYGKSKAGLDSHQTINDDGEEEEEDSFLYNHRHSEPLNLPAGLHNKALNKQAWKRAEPVLDDSMAKSKSNPLPTTTTTTSQLAAGADSSSTKLMDPSALAALHQSPSSLKLPSPTPSRPPITLDEYAEWMRMAAIMLAQLSASQQPSQSLLMNPLSAAGMVVGGAIGLGAGFVGVTFGAGLGVELAQLHALSLRNVIT
ncbi:hypothetical protein PtA15_10A603 [Puccinia triticina]|nr:uncharacterized protein PtA15_10A603 [Puccinia triticina]WAQ89179.1 hypothetical protein PtA15_10A603 [Puccinia triticina]